MKLHLIKNSESCSVVSDSLWSHGLQSPWTSPGQNTGVGSRSLLQGIFPTQGLSPVLLHCRQILYQLSHHGVQFSHSVMSKSLWRHEPQHARTPCASPTPGVYPNSCPLSRWCHPTISSSVVLFSSCPQSFLVSGSFQMSQFSASDGQSIGVSASTSVPPMNTQDWSTLGWTGWISLKSKGTLKSLLQHHSSKASILRCSAFFIVQLSHPALIKNNHWNINFFIELYY